MECSICKENTSTKSTKTSLVIELAACRNHFLCRDCYAETIKMRSVSNSEINISCPLCLDITNTTTNNTNKTNNEDNTIIIHSYELKEELWSLSYSNRLLDVQQRYDTYYQYFQQYKTVFIHIPKTAGTSFEYALFNTKNRSQHAKASYWKERIGDKWDKYFKFAIVRHPFHRLVSGYTYWKNGALAGQEVDQPFVHRCRKEIDTLEKFVAYLMHVHQNNLWDERDIQGVDGKCPIQFRPQTWFLSNNNNELINLDYIGRYEDLDQSYEKVKYFIREKNKDDNVNLNFCDLLPHTRASFHLYELPPIFKDPNFISQIMEIYKSDFDTFNYSI